MQEQRRKLSGLGAWPNVLITPCCLWACCTEIFPATLPFHNSQDTPQLTNYFAERLKPTLDHKSCGQSSMQERACPWGPKTDLPSWSKQLQKGGCIPVPLQWDKPCPSTGAGQYSKYLREQKFNSTPELPVDFLQQQLGHKNCQCVTRRFMYCTLDNYCGKAALYKQSCSYKCYHISGFLARNSSFLVLCWTFPSKSQALVSLVFNFIQPPFWDYQES